MTHPIPPGTRDVLPDEMRELRRLQRALAEVFEARGYGEVATPTIEYHEVLARGDERGAPGAYRFFDERGELLAMRSDMTIPIARLVSSRYADAELPLRFFYIGNAYRAVRPQRGQMREFMQAGVELIGADAPEGTAEVVEVLVAALDAAGLTRAVIGLGDADLYRQLLDRARRRGRASARRSSTASPRTTWSGSRPRSGALDAARRRASARRCCELPTLRGGAEVLEQARELGGEAVERATAGSQATYEALVERGRRRPRPARPRAAARPRLLHRRDPRGLRPGARPHPRRRRPLRRADGPLRPRRCRRPASRLYLERVHIAQAEEERIARRRDR